MNPILLVILLLLAVGLCARFVLQTGRGMPQEPAWLRNARSRRQRVPTWFYVVAPIGMVVWAIGLGMFVAASGHNPDHPDPATGHIYAHNNHGYVVYVTWDEAVRIYGTMAAGLVMLGGSMLVARYLDGHRRKHPSPHSLSNR
jgi:hypothetical protein